MFLLMISCFLVCWTPYAVVSMMEAFSRTSVISPTLAIIPSFFAKSSTAYNPLIYVFMSRKVGVSCSPDRVYRRTRFVQSLLSCLLFSQFRCCFLQLLCSRISWLQHNLKERPLTPAQRPVRPIVVSSTCDSRERPKKRVTFNSSSIVFIVTSNDLQQFDLTSRAEATTQVNVIQVRPL